MTHRLNTNKQFMIGNGILAFAVIFVVVIFVYMSMRLQQQKSQDRYTFVLESGFAGDSLSLLINDSLILTTRVAQEPLTVEAQRFAEQSALMLVDHATDALSIIELSEKGGTYTLRKEGNEVKHTVK